MDRELLLLLLVFLGPAPLAVVGSYFPHSTNERHANGWAGEREAWCSLWLPLVPALVAFAALVGWVVREPASAESLPIPAILITIPFALLLLRAFLRAGRALKVEVSGEETGTVGLLRPRLVISGELCARLEERAVLAVVAHERAHARHRDPLRMWLAQLATEVQGRSSRAVARYDGWRYTLEVARDEEARRSGVAGEDLAVAILEAARLYGAKVERLVPLLSAERLHDRIERLLQPLPPQSPAFPWRIALSVALVGICVSVAAFAGGVYGEQLVRGVCGG